MRKRNLSKMDLKAIKFATLLSGIYRDEEERDEVSKLELKSNELTEDFTAMLWGMFTVYKQITEDEEDIIGFTHLLNRLAVQDVLKRRTNS